MILYNGGENVIIDKSNIVDDLLHILQHNYIFVDIVDNTRKQVSIVDDELEIIVEE
jgi:hypothetical protein